MRSTISEQSRQEVRAFWTGPALSFYEQLSLKSMVASGARVILYSYEDDLAVPGGVELADAREILPWPSDGHREKNRFSSLALHSDLFRYIVLHRFGGWYVDLDLILLRDRLPSQDTYIAHGGPDWICTSVMRFPAGAPIMAEAIEEAQRLLPDADMSIYDADRAVVGPTLMTRLVAKHVLNHPPLLKSNAYEIEYSEALSFFDPARCDLIQDRVAKSDFTHLWNEVLRFIRIPKTLGPPAGSYLDVLFRRYGIDVSERARLSFKSIADWDREYRLLENIKRRLSIPAIEENTLDDFASSVQLHGWQFGVASPNVAAEPHVLSKDPQTIRTFWHGEAIGPYQLLCLRSFADRGHRVEVFTYSEMLDVPDWITVKKAGEILPPERVLRPLGSDGRFAIHGNRFRYALLHQLGGWWIDPDVLLLKPDLPRDAIFLGGPDAFGLVPMDVLKFPAGHPILEEALRQTELLGDTLEEWDRTGASLFTSLLDRHGSVPEFRSREPLGPVSWFEVPDLFNPACAAELNRKCNDFCFLNLHDDVWRRAGVPHGLAPPEGSLLYSLLARHPVNARFAGRIAFNELNRWIAHMYQCVRQRQA